MLNTKRTLATGLAIAGALSLTALPAQAENGRHAAAAVGAIGGLAVGAAIAGAASQPRSYYSGPSSFEVYDEAPAYAPVSECHIERRQVFVDQARYRWQRVRVCD